MTKGAGGRVKVWEKEGVGEACMSNAESRRECFLVSFERGRSECGQCIGFNR